MRSNEQAVINYSREKFARVNVATLPDISGVSDCTNNNIVSFLGVVDNKAYFLPPITTYSYSIELINGGNADFTFKSLIIKEVSKEEFDEDRERIEKLKKIAVKGQKKRRKNKRSK